MNKFIPRYLHFFGICYFLLLAIALFLAVSNQIITLPLVTVTFTIAMAIGAMILRHKDNKKYLSQLKSRRLFIIVAIIVATMALVARFAPLLFGWDYTLQNDLGDASVHYYGAQQLSHGWLEDSILEYDQLYPYLYPYSLVLSIFCKIFRNIALATLCSNTIFDIIGAIFIYLFIKNISSKRAAAIGMLLYFVNPFSIIMCWMPLSIEIVNTILCITLYLLQTLFKNMHKRKSSISCVLAVATGVLICIGNSFRPIFSVFIVIFILCCPILFAKYFKTTKASDNVCKHRINTFLTSIIAPLLIFLLSFTFTSVAVNRTLASKLATDNLRVSGGWSFYVGSNYATSGTWSRADSQHFFLDIIPTSTSIDDAQSIILNEGIVRYQQLNLAQFINHFANKLNVLFGDSNNSIHDLKSVFGFNGNGWKYKLLQSVVSLFFAIILALSTCFAWNSINDKSHVSSLSIVILQLTLLGLTAGLLIVEVMNRYASVFYPVLIIMSALFIHNKLNRKISFQVYSQP